MASSTPESDSHVPRRAPVTYGRRRHGENDTSSSQLMSIEVHKGPSLTENAKPAVSLGYLDASSEPECADDEKNSEEQEDTSSRLTFGWKKRLMELDSRDDLSLATLSGSNDQAVSLTKQWVLEPPFKARGADSEIHCATLEEFRASKTPQKPLTSVNGSAGGSPRRSPSLSPATSRASNPSTPGISIPRRRVSKRAVVPNFDSDSEPSQDRLVSSTNTSPPLIFQTPGSRSSPTPPTSDDEMPSRPVSRGKGKIRASSRRSVPPLQFEEELPSGPDSGSSEGPAAEKQKTLSRTKAPTKKELQETTRNRARLAADQHVSISKADSSYKFTIQSLLTTLVNDQNKGENQSSDPIVPFSSSPLQHQVDPHLHERRGGNTSSSKILGLPTLAAEKDAKMTELLAKKRQALALQSAKRQVDEDEDDDLIIVAEDSPATKNQKKLSRGTGGFVRQRHSLAGSTIPRDSRSAHHKAGNPSREHRTQAQLSRELLESAKEQGKQLTKQKEQEWVRKGGQLKNPLGKDKQDPLHIYIEKALQNNVKKSTMDTEDTDPVDHPMEEPARDFEFASRSEEVAGNQGAEDLTRADDQVAGEMADEVPGIQARRRGRPAVIDSDSDSEKQTASTGNNPEIKFGRSRLAGMLTNDESDDNSGSLATATLSVAHRDSLSSLDDLAEDRSDKENNQKLMFDISEDKENKAVVRHGIPSANQTMSLTSSHKQIDDGDLMKPTQRSPLTVLSEDESKLPQPEPSWTDMFALQPVTLEHDAASANQFEAPLLRPSFTDLFEAATQGHHASLVNRTPATPRASGSNYQPTNDLGLTQDLVLQPAFSAGDQVLRKADSIFEKEQEYLLEAAHKKAQKRQFYVNDFGFLTQTRPNGDAELYQSPLVTQRIQRSCSEAPITESRRPLKTLSLSDPDEDDEESIGGPRRRLVKRRTPSPSRVEAIHNADSPPHKGRQAKSAFNVLMAGISTPVQHERSRRKLDATEFVEAEAEESDDDDVFGIGLKKDENEEDGEDLDRTLETLVDDCDMDENTLAPQRVLEKFKEHVEEDDQELEKLHQAATKGELRRKRRNRMVGLDDSDEESDEDERNYKIRRRMSKKQRIDRDNIKALGDNEETKSFYRVYEHDLADDDNMELAYLQHQQDVKMDEPTDSDAEDAREPVTQEEIRRRVREMAQGKEADVNLDPHDVSWIDGDNYDEDAGMTVKLVNTDAKKTNLERRGGLDDHDESLGPWTKPNNRTGKLEGEPEMSRWESWAKAEGKRASGRSSGPVAVTGHAQTKGKTNTKLQESPPNNMATRRMRQRAPLKAIPSMLAGITDRSARFA